MPTRPGFLPVDDYLALPRERDTFLLKPLIPSSGACLLYGDAKVGKSYMAIQLALALSGQSADFLGFPVCQHGPVLYLQLDTPRNVWAARFDDMIHKNNLKYDSSKFFLADRESVEFYPFDIIQPAHMKYLYSIIQTHKPVAVIIDTLREAHSGDENDSTVSRNVTANLVGATHPAALIIISHGRKPHPDTDKDLLADHRGSSYITGRMDAILRLTRNRLYYTGRSIEAGDIRLQRLDSGLWMPTPDEHGPAIAKVMSDPTLTSMRAKARILAVMIGIGEEAAMSRLRRMSAGDKPLLLHTEGVDKPEISC